MAQPTIIIQNDSGGRSGGSGSILGGLLPSKVWGIVGILLIIAVGLVAFSTVQYYQNYVDENCPDANGLVDVGFCAVENSDTATDTGDSAAQAFLSSALWASPFGYLGAAIGIRTEGDTAGARVGNNFTRVKNGLFTFYKRLSGR